MMTIVSSALYAIAAAFCDEVYLMEEPLKRIFSLFGKRTLFVLGYHIAAGFLVYPIFDFVGDPIEIMERFWYVYWLINMAVVYLLIRFLPEPVLTILSGSFLAKRKRSSPKHAPEKS